MSTFPDPVIKCAVRARHRNAASSSMAKPMGLEAGGRITLPGFLGMGGSVSKKKEFGNRRQNSSRNSSSSVCTKNLIDEPAKASI